MPDVLSGNSKPRNTLVLSGNSVSFSTAQKGYLPHHKAATFQQPECLKLLLAAYPDGARHKAQVRPSSSDREWQWALEVRSGQ